MGFATHPHSSDWVSYTKPTFSQVFKHDELDALFRIRTWFVKAANTLPTSIDELSVVGYMCSSHALICYVKGLKRQKVWLVSLCFKVWLGNSG